jgi:hypothetical protein
MVLWILLDPGPGIVRQRTLSFPQEGEGQGEGGTEKFDFSFSQSLKRTFQVRVERPSKMIMFRYSFFPTYAANSTILLL